MNFLAFLDFLKDLFDHHVDSYDDSKLILTLPVGSMKMDTCDAGYQSNSMNCIVTRVWAFLLLLNAPWLNLYINHVNQALNKVAQKHQIKGNKVFFRTGKTENVIFAFQIDQIRNFSNFLFFFRKFVIVKVSLSGSPDSNISRPID